MAFHDPIDAMAWALNVQHHLLPLLPGHPISWSTLNAPGQRLLIAQGGRSSVALEKAHGHPYWQARLQVPCPVLPCPALPCPALP